MHKSDLTRIQIRSESASKDIFYKSSKKIGQKLVRCSAFFLDSNEERMELELIIEFKQAEHTHWFLKVLESAPIATPRQLVEYSASLRSQQSIQKLSVAKNVGDSAIVPLNTLEKRESTLLSLDDLCTQLKNVAKIHDRKLYNEKVHNQIKN